MPAFLFRVNGKHLETGALGRRWLQDNHVIPMSSFSHTNPNWPVIAKYILNSCSCYIKFMFRYHNNLLPPLFLNLFMTNSQVHRYDTRTAGNYRVHSCRTNIQKFTILYQGPRVWNCLPASITNFSSFSTFKNKALEFLLK